MEYMNRYLPDDICVDEVKLAADRFHARYRAVGKLYTYTCYVGATKPVSYRYYVTTLDYVPDVAAMQRAAEILTGEHDFKSFCTEKPEVTNTVRTIYSLNVIKEGDMIIIRVTGNGFLYNMVRIISGTLIEIGNGQYPPERMQKILDAKDRSAAGSTAPAQGLTLMGIQFFD